MFGIGTRAVSATATAVPSYILDARAAREAAAKSSRAFPEGGFDTSNLAPRCAWDALMCWKERPNGGAVCTVPRITRRPECQNACTQAVSSCSSRAILRHTVCYARNEDLRRPMVVTPVNTEWAAWPQRSVSTQLRKRLRPAVACLNMHSVPPKV